MLIPTVIKFRTKEAEWCSSFSVRTQKHDAGAISLIFHSTEPLLASSAVTFLVSKCVHGITAACIPVENVPRSLPFMARKDHSQSKVSHSTAHPQCESICHVLCVISAPHWTRSAAAWKLIFLVNDEHHQAPLWRFFCNLQMSTYLRVRYRSIQPYAVLPSSLVSLWVKIIPFSLLLPLSLTLSYSPLPSFTCIASWHPSSVTHMVPRPLQGMYQVLSRQANSLPNAKFH